MALIVDVDQVKQFVGAYCRVHGFSCDVDQQINTDSKTLVSMRFSDTGIVISFTDNVCFIIAPDKIDDKTTRGFANLLAEELSHVLTVMEFKMTFIKYFGQTPFILTCEGQSPLDCVVAPLTYGIGETDQF